MGLARIVLLLALPLLVAVGCATNPYVGTCDDPEFIEGSGVYEGTTTDAPRQQTATCGGSAGSSEEVYQLDLAVDSNVVLNTDGSDFDTVLHMRSGSCDDGEEIGCNDDGGADNQSALTGDLMAGTYFIFVDGFSNGASGPYTLNVSITPL